MPIGSLVYYYYFYRLVKRKTNVDIHLHLASLEDLELVLPFVRKYHEFEHLESTATERESAVRKLLDSSGIGSIWLIYSSNELAGYIVLCRGFSIEFNGFDAFVDEFFLSNEFRGKGVGTQVLELIKEEAKKLKINALHLEVARDNTAAQKLYFRTGFVTREKYLLMSVELHDEE